MKNSSPLLLLGLVINSFITLFMFVSEEYQILGIPSLISVLVSVLGFILILVNKTKIGGILFIIGSVLFVPIGLIGIVGAQKTMNKEKNKNFIKQTYGTD